MNVVPSHRIFQHALVTPVAVGGVLLTLLTAACADGEDPQDTAEQDDSEETTAEDSADGDGDDAAADGESPDVEADDGDVFTLAEVEENNTPESCWAVIEDTVYDLTDWIDRHPGGEQRIEQLCGTDASAAFDDQHGGQDRPEAQLTEFEIGSLQE